MTKASSQLLALPPEVRNIIYEQLFTVEPGKNGAVTVCGPSPAQPRSPSVLSLLQTCKQVRDEAQTMFYHINHLRIYSHNLGHVSITNRVQFNFLGTISSPRRESIRAMTILVSNGIEAIEAAKALQNLPALQTLRLQPLRCSNEGFYSYTVSEEFALVEAVGGLRALRIFEFKMPSIAPGRRLSVRTQSVISLLRRVERDVQAHLNRLAADDDEETSI